MSDTWKLSDEELLDHIEGEIHFEQKIKMEAYLTNQHASIDRDLNNFLNTICDNKNRFQGYLSKMFARLNDRAYNTYQRDKLEKLYATSTIQLNNLLNHWNNTEADVVRFEMACHPFYLAQSNKRHHVFFKNYQPEIANRYQACLLDPSLLNNHNYRHGNKYKK